MTTWQLCRPAALTTALILCAKSAVSIPTSPLNLESLSAQSDLILVGRIGPFVTVGKITVQIGTANDTANVEEAHADVIQILKGDEPAPSIVVQVPVLQPSGGSVNLDGIPDNSTRLLFLRRISNRRYRVVDPHHPSLPGISVTITSQKLLENIASVECGVIAGGSEPANVKLEAMWGLRGVDATCVIPTLRGVMLQQAPTLRMTVESELVRRNDTPSLGQAIADALSNQASIPEYLKENILASIGDGVHDEAAIQILTPLLRSDRESARLAAVRALKNIGTKACVPELRSLLSDSSQQVRYYAVAALADIAGLPEMHPSIPEFQKNEAKYTSYWK